MSEAKIGAADRAYFNGAIKKVETTSSILVSSSAYLNHPELRHLIGQEMLRRNGDDLPNTAFIPEVAQILHDLEDMEVIIGLFEAEKARLPLFKTWLEQRSLSDFTLDQILFDVVSAVGTVGLSSGISSSLPDHAKVLFSLLMLFGRLGPIVVATSLALRRTRRQFEYPRERPLIGYSPYSYFEGVATHGTKHTDGQASRFSFGERCRHRARQVWIVPCAGTHQFGSSGTRNRRRREARPGNGG